ANMLSDTDVPCSESAPPAVDHAQQVSDKIAEVNPTWTTKNFRGRQRITALGRDPGRPDWLFGMGWSALGNHPRVHYEHTADRRNTTVTQIENDPAVQQRYHDDLHGERGVAARVCNSSPRTGEGRLVH